MKSLFFFAKFKDKKIGIISAESKNLLGLKGCYFSDILMTPSFVGQGWAPLIQSKFIDQLVSQYKIIWETIDPKNTPSTKTALRVGRKIVKTQYFIPVDS